MKLSANSILQQGRYRIIGVFAETSDYSLYDAYDNLLGNKIVVHESPLHLPKNATPADRVAASKEFAASVKHLSSLRHEGIVRVRDGFSEGDRQYLITEPVEAEISADDFTARPKETISRLLGAIGCLQKVSSGCAFEIGPSRIRRTPDGNNRLLFFGFPENVTADPTLTPYWPLEVVWKDLDVATRKAISNEYSDDALSVLESTPDERSSIYALAASVYQIVTGNEPIGALERSVEMLEGNGDSFAMQIAAVPTDLRPFIAKSLELRREDRFQDPKTAAESFAPPTAPAVENKEFAELLELFEPNAPIEAQASFEPAEETSPSPIGVTSQATEPMEFSLANDAGSAGGRGKLIAIAAAALVVIGIAVFAVMNLSTAGSASATSTAGSAPTTTVQPGPAPATQTAEPAVSAHSERAEQEAAKAETGDNAAPSVDAPTGAPSAQVRQKASVAESKPVKKEAPKPAEKPAAAKPKKAVTVDDLIGDN
jgi:hypothetical protein